MSLTKDRACANVSCAYEGHATTCMHVRCLSNYVHATTCMHVRMQDLFPVDLPSGTWCIYVLYVCVSVCLPGLHVCFFVCISCLVYMLHAACADVFHFSVQTKKTFGYHPLPNHWFCWRWQCTLSARSVHAQCTLQCTLSAHLGFTGYLQNVKNKNMNIYVLFSNEIMS